VVRERIPLDVRPNRRLLIRFAHARVFWQKTGGEQE
jgi:hypothetical protein